MDPPSRSPALNPASTPFFPGSGAMRLNGDDGNRNVTLGANPGYRQSVSRDQQFSSTSSFSISPSDYRSVRSSPSPPQEDTGRRNDNGLQVPSPGEFARHSPGFRQADAERALSMFQNAARELDISPKHDIAPDGDETPGPTSGPIPMNGQLGSTASFYNNASMRSRERLGTPPVMQESGSVRSAFIHPPFMSSSPASSLDSGSHFAPSHDFPASGSFEVQLKSSPLMNEVLDRLARLELTNREIQRDLGDVHRKVDILVERALNQTPGHGQGSGSNGPVEFKDPFAPSSQPSQGFLPQGGFNGPRGSIANIAPNQNPPADDITTISTRLNTLTTSVGQLLALQTQQIHANSGALLGGGLPPADLAPGLPPLLNTSSSLGHGIPGRSDMRQNPRMPNPPMRTWSAGTLDLPHRNTDSPAGSMGRQDSIFRDKRRSVSGLLRRDSAGGESLSGGMSRDGGPVITKWEQLNLAPDLLRSLNTFGVGPPNKIQQRALPFLLRGSDIIAQAPPTQERIAAYVIPAIHIAVTYGPTRTPVRGPLVVMISTTVDQATQAQRMIRDLGGPIGIKSALGVGSTTGGGDLSQELRILQQNVPHIICGTPQKLHALFTAPGGLSGSEVRFLVLDEVDQLIARNLHDFVFNIIKLLPPPRSRSLGGGAGTPVGNTPGSTPQVPFQNFEASSSTSSLLAPTQSLQRRLSGIGSSPPMESANGQSGQIERQTALFSNTVPQDVLNLASAIQLREPVRVLVRRDGNVTHADTSQGARGLRQFYLYLAFTASGRSDAPLPQGGLGTIGSGRGAISAETAQAREWKLDALADLFEDLDIPQAIIHVGGMAALDAVVYKLSSRGLDAVPLHGDMNAGAKLAALNKFRATPGIMRPTATKVLVVYDVQVKTPEVSQIPLVINYDLPKAVEEYAHRVAPAIAPSYSRAGVVVNFVTATGGDVEMLRSIECFYKIKCPEVPMSLRDIV